jgi:hypothetical protein
MGQDHARAARTRPLKTLQFIAVLAAGAAILLLVRLVDPWIMDRVAIYVALSYAGMAAIAAVVGLLKA